MKRWLVALPVLLSLASWASATPPPLVGDVIQRGGILCDTVEQARSIVEATRDLGWEAGGKVMFEDYVDELNSRGESICFEYGYVGKVTAVESVGRVVFKRDVILNVWLVTIWNPAGTGTLVWSDPAADPEKPLRLPPNVLPSAPDAVPRGA